MSTVWAVRAQTGKGVLSQLREVLALRARRVGPREYYRFRLFDDHRFTPSEKREFTGYRFEAAVYRTVNDPGLMAASGIRGTWDGKIDKVLFDSLMRAGDIRTPKILAIYDPAGPEYYGVPVLRTVGELESSFRSIGTSGFFAKPARAHSGTGALSVRLVEGDEAHLADGATCSLSHLARLVAEQSRVVIQERLLPHPVLAELSGPTVATLRVVVLRGDEASEIHRVVLRIPIGSNVVDNFDAGRNGNLVGWVDPEEGRLLRVYSGWGLDLRRVARHPDSGKPFDGLALPDWEQATRLIRRASRVLVGMPFQSWDLALTSLGPVMIEVNDVSGQNILQLAGPPGLLDRRLCDFLRERGLRWPYPHPASERAPLPPGGS
jgi:Sugar-transfer associated ATP-grasp